TLRGVRPLASSVPRPGHNRSRPSPQHPPAFLAGPDHGHQRQRPAMPPDQAVQGREGQAADRPQPRHRRVWLRTMSWGERIGRHITPDGCVVVPPRVAHWLEKEAGVTIDRRLRIRDNDPAAYEVLAALHLAALTHDGSDCGTKTVAAQRT